MTATDGAGRARARELGDLLRARRERLQPGDASVRLIVGIRTS